jgi:hypothetical protein
MENDDLRKAYHEAGHVLMAWELGLSIRYSTILPTGKGEAHTELDDPLLQGPEPWMSDTMSALEAKTMMGLAGMVAESILCGDPKVTEDRKKRHDLDWKKVVESAGERCIIVNEQEPYIRWLELRTRVILEYWWRAVEALVGRFQETPRLERDDIYRILRADLPGNEKCFRLGSRTKELMVNSIPPPPFPLASPIP